MAQISLHDYLQQIDTLLEENRLSEAIAHCRHILSKFPRYVDVYRLYGKALLEQQKYEDAVDIFQRVLSADPEDFISHVALAITHKEKEEIPQAIWHFERAFEMDPYNAAIQDELRGLYAHRDGQRPERINLTRGALARLYFRGNLYQQAAAELRQILAKNSDRLDLQTLLAETLWRDDQRVDVVDVCLQILDKIPYCIKANAILAEVWLVTGRNEEAQEYLQKLRMLTRPEKAHLDLDSVVGRAFSTNGVIDLPDEILIEELDYFPAAQEVAGEADWVTELGIETEEDEEANWLDEIEKVDADVFAEAAATDEEMLDWLREVAESEDDEEAILSAGMEQSEGGFEGDRDDAFDWFSEGADTSRESLLSDVPDWLSEVTASAEADMWDIAVEANEGLIDSDELLSRRAEGEKPETPDWIREVADENAGMTPLAAWQQEDEKELVSAVEGTDLEAADDVIPDWMRGEGADADEFPDWLMEPGEVLSSEAEMLGWLNNPDAEPDVEEGFPDLSTDDTVFGLTGEELPDWLLGPEELAGAEEGSAFEAGFETEFAADFEMGLGDKPESADLETDDDLPDWLAGLGELDLVEVDSESDAEASFDAGDEALPDWLSSFEELDLSALETEQDPAAIFGAGDELPDWLAEAQEMELSEMEEQALEQSPNWLKEDAAMGGNEDDQKFTFDSIEFESEVDEDLEAIGLPDWLESSPELIVGQTDIDQDALPDWLDGGDQEDIVREDIVMGNSEEQENKEPDIPEDLDEAMKWLEELAAQQGADPAELPSLKVERPAADASAVENDDVPDWLKADLSDGGLSTGDDLPDWLKNEAISMPGSSDWLDLSDEDALSDLDMEDFDFEDSRGLVGAAEISDDIPDWLKAQMPEDLQLGIGNTQLDSDDDLGWLDQIAAGEGAPIEELPTLSWDEGEDDIGLESGDLSWLEGMADEDLFEKEAAADLPDIFSDTAEASVSTQVPDDPDEAIVWLEQLAAQQGVPLDELPTVVDEVSFAGEFELEEIDQNAPAAYEQPEETGAMSELELPEDPDEAMAWLEQLAARQGASLDELPTLKDEVPLASIDLSAEEAPGFDEVDQDSTTLFELPDEGEVEPVSSLDVPEDPDDAMAWLEQLAAQQGAPLDELPTMADFDFEEELTIISEMDSSEMPTVIDRPYPPADEVESESADFDIPDDPDDAMAWLEKLAARQGASLDELPTVNVVDEMDTPVTGIIMESEEIEVIIEAEAVSEEPEVDDELEMALADLSDIEMPEDDDQALAWLAALTTGETAEASETAADEPEDLFEPAFSDFEAVQEAESFEPVDDYSSPIELVEGPPAAAWEETEEISLFDAIEDETDQFINLEDELPVDIDSEFEDEALASALPDWLQFGPVGDTSREELDWLDSFGDSDVDSWLEAEELTSQVDLTPIIDTAELDPTPFQDYAPVSEIETMDEEDDFEETTFDVGSLPNGPIDQSQLESARSALEIGDYDTALKQYNSLLDSGQGLSLLIADLESASTRHGRVAPLQRLLGDAYMQNGQLQKAIDTYRQALDNL